LTRDEKARADFFLDHLVVGSPAPADVDRYIDLGRLKGSHHDYAVTQTTRDTLAVDEARLIVIDSYSDMNFKAWQHRDGSSGSIPTTCATGRRSSATSSRSGT
jgi:hypothetical protein